jgi:hypothetical protein
VRLALPATVILLAFAALALARDAREQARIDFLLQSVEKADKAVFIRNGGEHDGKTAAKHLRQKLDYVGERVQTAEQFIKYCASESSLTHQKYKIRLPDGQTMDAAEFLTNKLREFDAAKH